MQWTATRPLALITVVNPHLLRHVPVKREEAHGAIIGIVEALVTQRFHGKL